VDNVESVDSEVRGRLYQVLEGAISVEQFEEWFVARTWDERTPLVAHLDHLLAERSLLSDGAFVEEMRRLATTIAHTEVPLLTTTSATGETIRPQGLHVGGTETIRSRLALADT
jgi:hypothetical protein